jgi:hypothetical protein
MKFSLTSHKKMIAAAVTAIAAIAIPAQATDCTTICQNAASQAGNAAAQQAQTTAPGYCATQMAMLGISQNNYNYGTYYGSCMYNTINNAYLSAYNQTLAGCTGSCH